MVGMMENAFLNVKNRHYTITAPVELHDSNTNGVIIAQGGGSRFDCGPALPAQECV